jgi:RNA polymerase sigma-70 factor (ECF subfamily)
MAGLPDTFEEMYRTYYRMLRNAAANIIGDLDASHDIVQEVFLKLWHRREELHAILNPKAYLYRSVINSSITFLENNKPKTGLNELKLEAGSKSDSNVMMKELEIKLQAALDNLPPKCKAIFVLSRFEGLKNKEIAETLGLSLKTVENQMGIALKKLRDDLRSYMNDEFFSLILAAGASLWLASMYFGLSEGFSS